MPRNATSLMEIPVSPSIREFAHKLLSHSVAGEFARYVAAGLLALCIDFGLYVALTELLGWHYLASATVAFLCKLSGSGDATSPEWQATNLRPT